MMKSQIFNFHTSTKNDHNTQEEGEGVSTHDTHTRWRGTQKTIVVLFLGKTHAKTWGICIGHASPIVLCGPHYIHDGKKSQGKCISLWGHHILEGTTSPTAYGPLSKLTFRSGP